MMGDDGIPGLGSDFQLAEDTSGVESSILEGNPGRGRNAAGDKKKTPAAAAGAASPRPSPEAEEHLRNMLAEKNAALAICEAKKAEVLKKLSDLAGDYGSQYDRRGQQQHIRLLLSTRGCDDFAALREKKPRRVMKN